MTHLNNYANVFALNETFMTSINQRAEECGYFAFMEEALTFPPAGKFTAPNDSASGCDVWDDIVTAAIYVNPCFNIYHLTGMLKTLFLLLPEDLKYKPLLTFSIDRFLPIPVGRAWIPLVGNSKHILVPTIY